MDSRSLTHVVFRTSGGVGERARGFSASRGNAREGENTRGAENVGSEMQCSKVVKIQTFSLSLSLPFKVVIKGHTLPGELPQSTLILR